MRWARAPPQPWQRGLRGVCAMLGEGCGGNVETTRPGAGNYKPAAAPAYRATSDPSKRVAWEFGQRQRPAGEEKWRWEEGGALENLERPPRFRGLGSSPLGPVSVPGEVLQFRSPWSHQLGFHGTQPLASSEHASCGSGVAVLVWGPSVLWLSLFCALPLSPS